MAATITITDGLIKTLPIIGDVDLVPVFDDDSIIFTMTGAAAGDFPQCVINDIYFNCTLIDTNTYEVALGDVLKYMIAIPDQSTDYSKLLFDLTVYINAYSSTGTLLNSKSEDVKLYYGYSPDGTTGYNNIGNLFNAGRSDARVYHSGILQFYFGGAAGTYACTVGGVSVNYALVNGFNEILLSASHIVYGTFSVVGESTSFKVAYKSFGGYVISWLNEDGCYSNFGFSLLSKQVSSTSTGEINQFYSRTANKKGRARELVIEHEEVLNFYTIAYNDEHYYKLTQISKSLNIIYAGVAWLAECDTTTAECRQNLNFKITLKKKVNGATY